MLTILATSPQKSNACTLISIGAIEAILHSEDAARVEALVQVQKKYQLVYEDWLAEDPTVGAGVLERDAYKRFFADQFNAPTAVTLSQPVNDTDALIQQLIDAQQGWDDNEDFIMFNSDLLTVFLAQLRDGEEVRDWLTVTKEELQQKLRNELSSTQSFGEQIHQQLSILASASGMTLNGGGHTISVTRKGNSYFCFDSESGSLNMATDLDEMVGHLSVYFERINPSRSIEVYTFSPIVALEDTPVSTTSEKDILPKPTESPAKPTEPPAKPTEPPAKPTEPNTTHVQPESRSKKQPQPQSKPTHAPASYTALYKSAKTPLQGARALLDDYTKGNSAINRFFHGHWNRHHVKEVAALVKRIDAKELDLVTLMQELRAMQPHLVNQNGSLARRIRFLESLNPSTDVDLSLTKGMKG